MPVNLENYAGARYEYATVFEIIGTSVTEGNQGDPPYVAASSNVTITPTTNIVDALNELGADGWLLHSTTALDFSDGTQGLVFMVLSRPLQS